MDTIPTTTILDRGTQYLGNHPDHLAKRIALAQLLVDCRAVKSLDAGLLAFRIWAEPTAKQVEVGAILGMANDKSSR